MIIQIKRLAHLDKARFALFAFFGGLPITASVALFSFVAGISEIPTYSVEKDASAIVYNSQNTPILQAVLNSDLSSSRGGGDIVVVGNMALLPETGPSGTLADINERPSSDQISIYVVREGDSLSQIARMFNVSVNTIIWSNDIKRGSLITPGQTLVILPISGVRHLVKKGDTLKSITKKYKGDLDEILQYNGLTEDTVLAIGNVVVVPDGEIATPTYSTRSATRVVQGTGGPTYQGYYIRPLNGGRRSQALHGYNAVDLASSHGTPILAAAAGEVILSRNAGWNGGYGKYIVIRHGNGTQTLYAHNTENIIFAGQSVVQGQVIGYVGSTGKSTGPHVHFEIRGASNPF